MSEFLTIAPGVTIELVRIPAGEFLMGSLDTDYDARDGGEKPQHVVELDSYMIGKYLVTNNQYATFMTLSGKSKYSRDLKFGIDLGDWDQPEGPGSNLIGKSNHPVVHVDWYEAVEFCEWVSQITGRNVKLPTEAQWEKAARGTDGKIYPWGNTQPDGATINYRSSTGRTAPVGGYSPQGDSPYGVSDMVGHVWQWTSSLYKPYPYNPNDGREDQYSRDARVLRGGGFSYARWDVRSANRGTLRDNPDNRGGFSSFRVSVSPT